MQTINTFQELMYRAQLETLVTQREGMIAENKMREAIGEPPVYVEENFMLIVGKLTELRLQMLDGD